MEGGVNHGRCAESRPRTGAKEDRAISENRSQANRAGRHRGTDGDTTQLLDAAAIRAEHTSVLPRIPSGPDPAVYKGAAVNEWNWRIVAMSGFFCVALLGAAGILGILGERDGLYLAYGGFIGLVMSIITVTIDWLARR